MKFYFYYMEKIRNWGKNGNANIKEFGSESVYCNCKNFIEVLKD